MVSEEKLPQKNCETDAIVMLVCSAENVQEEQTAGEKVEAAWKKAGDKLTEWGILSPRLMLAGGGLFMTLSNWGLLPAVRLAHLLCSGKHIACLEKSDTSGCVASA